MGDARLEGWPPLFPDASVRGEAENIVSELILEGVATPYVTSAVQGAGDIAGQISGAEIAGACPAV